MTFGDSNQDRLSKKVGAETSEPKHSLASVTTNVGWWMSGHVFRMVATFAVGFWVIRHLGPSAFGELCVIRAIVGILNVIATMGLTQLLPIQLSSSKNSPSKILATAGVLRLFAGVAAAVVAVPILCWIQGYGQAELPLLIAASLLLVVSPTELVQAWFVSQAQTRITVLSRMLSVAITAVLQVVAVLCGMGILAFLAIDVVTMLCFGGILVILMMVYHRPSGVASTSLADVNQLVRRSAPVWLSSVAAIVSVRVDQAMLGVMAGETATGQYAAAARLSEFWFFVPIAIVTSSIPALTKQFEQDSFSYRRNVLRVSSVLTAFTFAVAIGTTLVAKPLVGFLFGAEFAIASGVLMLHVWSLPFFSLGYLSHNLRIIQGQQDALLSRTVAGAISNVALNYFLIPIYGIHGAAFSTLLSYIIGGIGWDLMIDRSYGVGMLQARSFLPQYWLSSARTVVERFRTIAVR